MKSLTCKKTKLHLFLLKICNLKTKEISNNEVARFHIRLHLRSEGGQAIKVLLKRLGRPDERLTHKFIDVCGFCQFQLSRAISLLHLSVHFLQFGFLLNEEKENSINKNVVVCSTEPGES